MVLGQNFDAEKRRTGNFNQQIFEKQTFFCTIQNIEHEIQQKKGNNFAQTFKVQSRRLKSSHFLKKTCHVYNS